MWSTVRKAQRIMFSPRGKNVLVFCAFLALATLLWMSKVLNEDLQRDLRCGIRITNVPDSVTRLSQLPDEVYITLRATGTRMALLNIGRKPLIDIDWKTLNRHGNLYLGRAQLLAEARRLVGGDSEVLSVSPDSLQVLFTTRRGIKVPVQVDAHITTMPNCALTGPIKSSVDTVMLYAANPVHLAVLKTQLLILTDVDRSDRIRVPIIVPKGMRAIPDSVDLSYNVEPVISRTARVIVKPVNVPQGYRMILLPNTVNVNYMMPMSRYDEKKPEFSVTADYNSLPHNLSSNRIPIQLQRVRGSFINVYLSTDSVDYIIEKQ